MQTLEFLHGILYTVDSFHKICSRDLGALTIFSFPKIDIQISGGSTQVFERANFKDHNHADRFLAMDGSSCLFGSFFVVFLVVASRRLVQLMML